MKKNNPAAALVLLLSAAGTCSADSILYPDTYLYRNQSIRSNNGAYTLVMQGSDGNLVLYRSDGTPRWSARSGGQYSVMQTDGNFVEYGSFGNAMFDTATDRHPGAFLNVQDDGNLVVYTPNWTPLWNIGVDSPPYDPKQSGDVVGRDLDVPGLGRVGHIGIWDGSQVFEAIAGRANAVGTTSLNSFKQASAYWGKAGPYIPDGWIYNCFQKACYLYAQNGGYANYQARKVIYERANQIRMIGADYSLVVNNYSPVQPATLNHGAYRGVYRCDTFVINVLEFSAAYSYARNAQQSQWGTRAANLWYGPILPKTVYDKLRTYE